MIYRLQNNDFEHFCRDVENDLRNSKFEDGQHNNRSFGNLIQQENERSIKHEIHQNSEEFSFITQQFNNLFKDIFHEIEDGKFQIPFNDDDGEKYF